MEDSKKMQMDRIMRYAHLIETQAGKAVRPYRADGFVNLLTRYGTSKDPNEHFKFVPEKTVPDELLTMFYEGNGLFAKIIDTPAEEAIKHGFTLADVSDQEVEDFYQEALDELDWEETAMQAIKWARLFGGSIAVMLINDGRGLEEPLDWKNIRSIDDIRVYDRSLIQPDYKSMYGYDPRDPFSSRGSRLGMPEYYHVFSKYGNFTVHDSRCLVFQNGVLPENTTNSVYQLWGIPEYIRIHRAILDAELAHRSAPKLLDRSVQPVYKMKDLAMELATEEGEGKVLKRLQTIDMARGMMNSIVVDSEGEDYDFKTFQFAGINDVVSASCSMLSAVSHIPQTVLFGQHIGGMSTTDDTSMENYYNYVERIRKRMLRSNLRYLLSVIFQAGVSTGEVDEIPKLKIEFNPLWSLSDAEQADLEQKREQTKFTRAQTTQLYINMQAVDPTEVRRKLADSEEFDIENMLDEYEDEELFPEAAAMEAGIGDPAHAVDPETMGHIPQSGDFAEYANNVSVEAHNNDPGDEGAAPASAPAATKLPQDMSEEELAREAAQKAQNNDTAAGYSNTQGEGKPFSVGVIVISEGKVLCGTRHNDFGYGLICGPGGHGEDGETPEQAAFRETEEEFGISPKELIPLGHGPREHDTGLVPYIFLCTDFDGEPDCVDLEMTNPQFRSLDEIEELSGSLFQPFKDGLALLLDNLDEDRDDGGPGSGNHGHKGVPGQVGGSTPSEGSRLSNRDKPNVMAGSDFDNYVKKNKLKPIYRGYSASSKEQESERAAAIRNASAPESGENSSALGKGVYYSNSESEASDYLARRRGETGDKFGRVSTAALDVGAKVGDYDELKKKHIEDTSALTQNAFKVMKEKGANSQEFQDAIKECESNNSFDDYVRNKGYDAIEHPATGYTVVINQNALVVREDSSIYFRIFPPKTIDNQAQSVTIKSQTTTEDGGPGSGNHGHKGVPGQVGGSTPQPSATGSNPPCKGFEHKKTLNWKMRKHGAGYPGVTPDQYEQKATALLQKPCGGDIDGYLTSEGSIVRFDTKTGDFAKGFPGGAIKTMFNPGYNKRGNFSLKRANDYFNRKKKGESI